MKMRIKNRPLQTAFNILKPPLKRQATFMFYVLSWYRKFILLHPFIGLGMTEYKTFSKLFQMSYPQTAAQRHQTWDNMDGLS